jgi:hypothetical protein
MMQSYQICIPECKLNEFASIDAIDFDGKNFVPKNSPPQHKSGADLSFSCGLEWCSGRKSPTAAM